MKGRFPKDRGNPTGSFRRKRGTAGHAKMANWTLMSPTNGSPPSFTEDTTNRRKRGGQQHCIRESHQSSRPILQRSDNNTNISNVINSNNSSSFNSFSSNNVCDTSKNIYRNSKNNISSNINNRCSSSSSSSSTDNHNTKNTSNINNINININKNIISRFKMWTERRGGRIICRSNHHR